MKHKKLIVSIAFVLVGLFLLLYVVSSTVSDAHFWRYLLKAFVVDTLAFVVSWLLLVGSSRFVQLPEVDQINAVLKKQLKTLLTTTKPLGHAKVVDILKSTKLTTFDVFLSTVMWCGIGLAGTIAYILLSKILTVGDVAQELIVGVFLVLLWETFERVINWAELKG